MPRKLKGKRLIDQLYAILEDDIKKEVHKMYGNRPLAPGHYWGRWHTPAPGTADNGEGCSGDEWEVHQVFENCLDTKDPEYLMAFVPGVSEPQPLENFEWGERVDRRKQWAC